MRSSKAEDALTTTSLLVPLKDSLHLQKSTLAQKNFLHKKEKKMVPHSFECQISVQAHRFLLPSFSERNQNLAVFIIDMKIENIFSKEISEKLKCEHHNRFRVDFTHFVHEYSVKITHFDGTNQ